MDELNENVLGQIKKLKVRRIWENEASDFTPWLAKEGNIALLGKSLGLELEVERIRIDCVSAANHDLSLFVSE